MTLFCDSSQMLTDILNDGSLDLKACQMVNDKVLQLTISKKMETQPPNRNACHIMNAYTTAYARKKLWISMKNVLDHGGALAYTDTDSIVVNNTLRMIDFPPTKTLFILQGVKKKGQDLGLYHHPSVIGAWKSEVPENTYIKDFYAILPKVYSINFAKHNSSQIDHAVTKCKGFSVKSHKNVQRVNSNMMQQMVEALQSKTVAQVDIPQFNLKIDATTKKIRAKTQKKMLRTNPNNKRWYRSEISPCRTFPWGTTCFETVNSPLCDELYYQNLACKGTEVVTLK